MRDLQLFVILLRMVRDRVAIEPDTLADELVKAVSLGPHQVVRSSFFTFHEIDIIDRLWWRQRSSLRRLSLLTEGDTEEYSDRGHRAWNSLAVLSLSVLPFHWESIDLELMRSLAPRSPDDVAYSYRRLDGLANALERAVAAKDEEMTSLERVVDRLFSKPDLFPMPDDRWAPGISEMESAPNSDSGWFGMTEDPAEDEESETGAPPQIEPEEISSRPFSAFPHLHAPAEMAQETRFDVTVGFRGDPDPALVEVQTIAIDASRITPNKRCQIVLIGDGVRLDRNSVELPLEIGAAVVVGASIEAGAPRARVRAQYVYDGELVGSATREIAIFGSASPAEPPNPCRMTMEAAVPPDLTATAMYSPGGTLQWTLFAKAINLLTLEPLSTRLGKADAREFAATHLKVAQESVGEVYWTNTLESLSVDVAQVVPTELFGAIRRLRDHLGRTPSVLFVTDETYVPWELAWMDPPLEANVPSHLGCQVALGRWVDESNIALPPACDVSIRRFYAIGHDTLPHSIEERKALEDRYHAEPLAATEVGLAPILAPSDERGRALHFAVHGYSNPAANEQSLSLADGKNLSARAFGRFHRCGEEAVCGFMFLNACQVGVVGTSLGHTSGFPGVMMQAGTSGFIAPLWDVKDGVAKRLALEFYENVLESGATVGEAMRQLRLSGQDATEPDPQGETRLAYVYYGHPNMKMTKR